MTDKQQIIKPRGRKPYSDPKLRKHKILLYPTFYEIELMGGEEATRTFLEQALKAKVEEKKGG